MNLKSLGVLKNIKEVKTCGYYMSRLWNPSDWFESQFYSTYQLCDFFVI